jgi:hypothetical protein
MQALQFWFVRLRILIIVLALGAGTGVSGPAWSAIQFSNGFIGTVAGDLETGILSGAFLQSFPFPLDTVTADLGAGTATWVDPDSDELHLTYVPDDGVFLSPALQKFTGTFEITGGTGKFLGNSGSGTFESFVFYSAPGTIALVTGINAGILIPEPAVWLILVAGLGLLGFVRIRRAANNVI